MSVPHYRCCVGFRGFLVVEFRLHIGFIAALVSLAMRSVYDRPYIDCVHSFKHSDVIGGAVADSG